MPTGDIVVFVRQSRGHGPHDKEAVRFLMRFIPTWVAQA